MLNILCQVGTDALEVNLLVGMKRELENRDWCQGGYASKDGRVCLLGALHTSLGQMHLIPKQSQWAYNNRAFYINLHKAGLIVENTLLLHRILDPYIDNVSNSNIPLSVWNDTVAENYQDVENLLDKAIADRGGFV